MSNNWILADENVFRVQVYAVDLDGYVYLSTVILKWHFNKTRLFCR